MFPFGNQRQGQTFRSTPASPCHDTRGQRPVLCTSPRGPSPAGSPQPHCGAPRCHGHEPREERLQGTGPLLPCLTPSLQPLTNPLLADLCSMTGNEGLPLLPNACSPCKGGWHYVAHHGIKVTSSLIEFPLRCLKFSHAWDKYRLQHLLFPSSFFWVKVTALSVTNFCLHVCNLIAANLIGEILGCKIMK